MRKFLQSMLFLAASLLALPGNAQLGNKPLKIVVPYAGGGGIDTTARGVARGLAEVLGQPVIVENRPGGNSAIGASLVAKSAPDGHTLLFTSGSTVAVLPHISTSLPLDPVKDLVPVGKVAKLPFFLVVNARLPVKNVQEYLAYVKASPDKTTYASAGNGTGAHLGFELLNRLAGVKVTHVPYKATREALPDLLTGRVDAMMADYTTVQGMIADGSLRALAVTTQNRSPILPALPSLAEQGVPGFDLELWVGLFAPAGTPEVVIRQLNDALKQSLPSPASASAFSSGGFTMSHSTASELAALISTESARWAELARAGVLKAE